MLLHFTILPKPVDGVPPVKAFCPKCGRETIHFLFDYEHEYFGPLVFMPIVKVLPKTGVMICASCVNMIKLSDENYAKFSKLEGETPQHKKIRDALAICIKRLYKAQNGSMQQRDTDINSAIIDYFNTAKSAIESTTRICPYCKEEIKATAVKCKYCHSDIEPLFKGELPTFTKTDYTEMQIIYCAECSEENYFGETHCRYCGAKLWYGGFGENDIEFD